MKTAVRAIGKLALIFSISYTSVSDAKLIFFESFDSKGQWSSTESTTYRGWTDHYNSASNWDETKGYPSHHANIEISPGYKGIHYGPSGGAMINWRESFNNGNNSWNSDGILLKQLDKEYKELYVTFLVAFSPEWTEKGSGKLFRVYSWDTTSKEYFRYFSNGNAGPMMLWGYGNGSYGVRNSVSLRGGPHGENYQLRNDDVADAPRQLVGQGDLSISFSADTLEQFPCVVPNTMVEHDQIYKRFPVWNRVEFYLKLNSEVDAKDGVLKQWINGKLVTSMETIPWVKSSSNNAFPAWNVVAFGGNDFFNEYPNEQRHEEWYAIDEIFVYDSLPEYRR